MSAKVWWPLFPLLFVIVLVSLITALVRLKRTGGASRLEWTTVSLALLFYFLTFALGRWRWLHMPMSNIAELFILFNAVHFFRKGQPKIAWLNIIALAAIATDFALHFILK
ncbi:MAG: hypothetical protein HY282_10940 [Nitrospirae bacterium]|nr:hypothetical protein [Candidatus Manganitrophaceae bacterium]